MTAQEHTEGGTAWELREAENAMVAAVDDPAARAVAMRRHTEATRNMMQGELMPSFVEALGRVLDAKLEPLLTGQKETHGSIAALSGQFQSLSETVDQLESDVAALKKVMAARPKQRVKERHAYEQRLAVIEADIAELKAARDGT